MSNQITTAFVEQYSNNVQMLSQQKGSLLRGSVDVETVVGNNAFFEQVGSATAQKRVSRHSDTPQLDTPHAKRRVSLVDYEYADLIDQQDKVRTLIDPTSAYANAAAFALGRSMDDEIIAAATGNAFTGATGSTSTALGSDQAITESGTDGLTIAKLRTAKEKFDLASVDPSLPRFLVVGPRQVSDLLGTTSVTSSDFNTVKALVNGEVDTFMGFKFITSTRLAIASSKRLCVAFAGDGIKLALGKDVMTRIDERSDKGYSTQVYVCMSIGATRMEESKVVSIQAHEA
ncbi:phage capsid protein [Pelagibacteraceae bacterium]|nr:phage capsid protein [Pelagibacteraceae bacterium]BAR32461.1 putative major capsid protein [uncultured Mediterranean phage uvMED]